MNVIKSVSMYRLPLSFMWAGSDICSPAVSLVWVSVLTNAKQWKQLNSRWVNVHCIPTGLEDHYRLSCCSLSYIRFHQHKVVSHGFVHPNVYCSYHSSTEKITGCVAWLNICQLFAVACSVVHHLYKKN